MTALTIGGRVKVPGLPGTWSTWSQAAETPGGYFVAPADEAARALGVKYAVIRAVRSSTHLKGPLIELVRTDPATTTAQRRGTR